MDNEYIEIRKVLDELKHDALQIDCNMEADNIDEDFLQSIYRMLCKALYYTRNARGTLCVYLRDARVKNSQYNERRCLYERTDNKLA